MKPVRSIGGVRMGAASVGAAALGAFAVGALAIGALAIGRLAVGRLAIGRVRIGRLEVGELALDRARDDQRHALVAAPGVAAVIRDNGGRVLLHRRRVGGGWAPASGRVEPGEAIREALAREVAEETRLALADVRLIGVYTDPAVQIVEYPDGRRVHFVTCLFAGHAADTEALAGNDEGLEWRWFAPDALPPDLLPYAARWLADALADGPAVRVR